MCVPIGGRGRHSAFIRCLTLVTVVADDNHRRTLPRPLPAGLS